ncbi:MAG TPA: FGGY family carbohydrate kinase [Mycobacteriales bacterium]|nr:FGGY family carbohydrate kinase [Mycobacteriales bacterium]
MQDPLVAGIDVGTTNTKIGLYTAGGRALAAEGRPTPPDVRTLRAQVVAALERCIRAAGRAPDAVGVTSMAETGVAVGADLEPLHEMIRWDDSRGGAEAERVRQEIGAMELWRRSGINLGVKTPLSRWLWLRRAGWWRSMRYWLNAADLIVTALGGAAVTDATLAARTGAFDIAAGDWSADILRYAGLPASVLPEVGSVARSGAVAGLRSGTPVVVAGHDHLVAAFAAGARSPGQCADSMGTAEALVTVTSEPPDERHAGSGISWNRTADGSNFCLLSGFPGSGRLIEWFGAGPDEFENLAESVTQIPTGIIVEPYLLGRSAPEPDSDRRIRISRRAERHGRADLALALLEGACYQVRWIAEEQSVAAKSAVDSVRVFGGPTRNAAWMRTKAAVMPGRLEVVRVADLAVVGAALIAGVRCGLISGAPTVPADPYRVSPETAAVYDELYSKEFLPRARSGK